MLIRIGPWRYSLAIGTKEAVRVIPTVRVLRADREDARMSATWLVRVATVSALVAALGAAALAQVGPPGGGAAAPAGGRGGGAQGPGGGRGPAPAGQPAVVQIPRSPVVDAARADAGKALWATHCINCHGTQARGSDTGPNIIRSETVNFDRSSPTPGSVLGPYLKKGHQTQSGKPSASFADDEVVALAQFLRQRVNDTMRGSPIFVAGDVLTGDAKAGEAYFNGEGRCATCHTATAHSLAGVARKYPSAVDLQQRMLFPGGTAGRGFGRAAAPAGPDPNAITVTIAPASGAAVSGTLVSEEDFYITYRDTGGQIRVVRRAPGMKVTTINPLQGHIDLLDQMSDKYIHDVVAYLETMK
jgi:cytochrome c oxidase cbb3-type subunit III